MFSKTVYMQNDGQERVVNEDRWERVAPTARTTSPHRLHPLPRDTSHVLTLRCTVRPHGIAFATLLRASSDFDRRFRVELSFYWPKPKQMIIGCCILPRNNDHVMIACWNDVKFIHSIGLCSIGPNLYTNRL